MTGEDGKGIIYIPPPTFLSRELKNKEKSTGGGFSTSSTAGRLWASSQSCSYDGLVPGGEDASFAAW